MRTKLDAMKKYFNTTKRKKLSLTSLNSIFTM